LPGCWGRRTIADLYRRRWDIETSFKDLTNILKMNQWHSQFINGILQEIYALFWLVNTSRACMQQMKAMPTSDLQEQKYKKSNMKLTVKCLLDYLFLLLQQKWKKFWTILTYWINRMSQTRIRNSRSYPRVVKHRGREYKQNNLVPRRSKRLTEQH
jgi:hypothetical protein